MTDQDIISILSDILDLSKKNRIRWTNTSTSAQFLATLGDATVTVDEFSIDADSYYYYTFNIFNDKGNVIFTYNTNEDLDATISSLIEKIYKIAENIFYKRDETIQSLKSTLSALKDMQ